MTSKARVWVIAGDGRPFLSNSKACYERFMRAIIETGSSLTETYKTGEEFLANLEIPIENIKKFKKIAKCSLRYHPNYVLGECFLNSTKWVDENGRLCTSPHPEVNLD